MEKQTKDIRPGDIAVYYDGWGVVKRVENGRLYCEDRAEVCEEIVLSPSEVISNFHTITVSAEQMRRFLRYEDAFSSLFAGAEVYICVKCEEKLVMTGDDLLAALRKCKENGYAKAEKEWIEPVRALYYERTFSFYDPSAPVENENYRFLPASQSLFDDLFRKTVSGRYDKKTGPDFNELIAQTEKTIRMLTLPVPERDYDDKAKKDYVLSFGNEKMIAAATNEELALFVRYTDELCAKNDQTALYVKAGSLCGGNRAYACDWFAARDMFLRMMKFDDSPIFANILGNIFFDGKCSKSVPEYDKAFYYYSIGAAGGIYESQYKLSDMFRYGLGVTKNEAVAAGIIRELYSKNRKHILNGETDSRFADIALRMGNLKRDGVGTSPDFDEAYRYYLEADFAIRQRMRAYPFGKDSSLASEIQKTIDDILPRTTYTKVHRTTYREGMDSLLSGAFALHRRVEAKIRKLKNGWYSLRFCILPMRGEWKTPRFFLTVPDAHFCGYADSLTVKAPCEYLALYGKQFKGEKATVVFDGMEYDGEYTLYGEPVLSIRYTCFMLTSLPKNIDKHHAFVSVIFPDGKKSYDYLCAVPDVAVGDEVVVPVPDGEKHARVTNAFSCAEYEMSLPFSRYKPVLRKV